MFGPGGLTASPVCRPAVPVSAERRLGVRSAEVGEAAEILASSGSAPTNLGFVLDANELLSENNMFDSLIQTDSCQKITCLIP